LVVPTLAKLTKDFTERRLVKTPGFYEKLGVQVILLPSIWLGLKLRSLLRENMRITLKRLRQTSFKRKKRQRSTTVRIQISTMPLWVKRLFLLSHISFGIVFAVLLFVLISAGPNNCEDKLTKEIWDGCKKRAYFCNNLAPPECDCLELVLGNYSQEKFPENIKLMKSLKILKVYTGQLKSLPENIGTKHPSLEMIFVAGTKLNSIPPSIGKLANLKHIRMFSNEIKTLPDELGDAKKLGTYILGP
jgi:hypothetical protein